MIPSLKIVSSQKITIKTTKDCNTADNIVIKHLQMMKSLQLHFVCVLLSKGQVISLLLFKGILWSQSISVKHQIFYFCFHLQD